MSLVGPEPLGPEAISELGAREHLRFDARPGVVGLAEVSRAHGGPDGDPVALDAYYVQNWSLAGDLALILKWLALCMSGRCADPAA
jgi:lipopolysaccharide/colanic/teichoic acid biosynthesis glycosyltransferase